MIVPLAAPTVSALFHPIPWVEMYVPAVFPLQSFSFVFREVRLTLGYQLFMGLKNYVLDPDVLLRLDFFHRKPSKTRFSIWGPSMQIWKWKTRCFKLNMILFGNVYSTSKAYVYLWCKLSSEAYSALLKAIPSANNSVTQDAQAIKPFPDVAPLNRDDYPNIKFWFKRQWIESLNDHVTDNTLSVGPQRGRARASLNVDVAMRYVETERGDLIDGDRASEIRKFARAIWVSFGKRGRAPGKWGQADVETRKEYCQEMNSRFPELRFCDLDWKSEQVATDNYPSWYTTWASKRKELKHESEEDITNKSAQSKRPRKPSTQSAVKRKKVENQTEGDDRLGEATKESEVVIVSANIPAINGNTQVNYQHLTLWKLLCVLIF